MSTKIDPVSEGIKAIAAKIKIPHGNNRLHWQESLLTIGKVSIVFGLCFVILLPIYRNLVLAFMPLGMAGDPSVTWVPKRFDAANLKISFDSLNFPGTLPYTIIFCVTLTLLQLLIAAMTGYALARMEFTGKKIIIFAVVLTIITPNIILIVPQFLHFSNFDILGIIKLFSQQEMNLINNPLSIYILTAFGMGINSGIYIFTFRQFFLSMPAELEEAAMIDGAGYIKIFTSIMIPNAQPAIIPVSLFSFVWQYNDTAYSSLFYKHLPLLVNFYGLGVGHQVDEYFRSIGLPAVTIEEIIRIDPFIYVAIHGAKTLWFMLPLLIVYFIVQKYLVRSIERSGIVG